MGALVKCGSPVLAGLIILVFKALIVLEVWSFFANCKTWGGAGNDFSQRAISNQFAFAKKLFCCIGSAGFPVDMDRAECLAQINNLVFFDKNCLDSRTVYAFNKNSLDIACF